MVGVKKFFFRSLIIIIPLLSGCSFYAKKEHRVPLITMSSDCLNISSFQIGSLSVKQHYAYMINCVKQKRYYDASIHYAIAGIQTWENYLENPTLANKKQHYIKLKKTLSQLSDDENKHFWDTLNIEFSKGKNLETFCALMTLPKNARQSQIIWKKARQGYLHCKN